MWFNPSGQDCGLNIFFIVMTMILALAFAIIALHPKVTADYIFQYLIKLMQSKPHADWLKWLNHT